MIKCLAHVCFHARDLDVSIAFYRDKLGLKEAFPFLKPDGRRFGVYLHAGGRNFIEIFEAAKAGVAQPLAPTQERPSGAALSGVAQPPSAESSVGAQAGAPVPHETYRHLCLEVEDIQGTVKAFRAKGVEVTDVVMGSDHSWQAWLADPDGNKIELHEYTRESKQTPHLR